MHTNIQSLFGMISVVGIRRYLSDRGWVALPSAGNDRLYFERTFAGGEPPATIWTWDSAENVRFRRQVPNIIFMLSVLESRPALEIANEMYSVGAEQAKSAAVDPVPKPVGEPTPVQPTVDSITPRLNRLQLRLTEATSITVTQDAMTDVVPIDVDDVVEIAHYGDPNGDLVLELAAQSIKTQGPLRGGLRLLQGVAKPHVGENWSAVQIVCEESRRLEDAGDSRGAAQFLEQIHSILARIDFELDVNAAIDRAQQTLLLRQAAVLAAAAAQRLPAEPLSRRLVWRTCAALLFPVGLRLELRSTSQGELFDHAAADNELSPKQTLRWLKENSVSVVG